MTIVWAQKSEAHWPLSLHRGAWRHGDSGGTRSADVGAFARQPAGKRAGMV
jgi:hypothetical protein